MNNFNYNLEIDELIQKLHSTKYAKILLQLPDGLKPKAELIKKELETKTNCQIFIWAGSNFGACDVPLEIDKLNFDAIIHFGHSPWEK